MSLTKPTVKELRQNLIVSAFDGGSNYWAYMLAYDLPTGKKVEDYEDKDYGEGLGRYNIPFAPKSAIVFTTVDELAEAGVTQGFHGYEDPTDEQIAKLKKWRLDKKTLVRGWKVMHDDYPSHYGDAISENDDAGTGDVYLQCCLFGEVIYG